MTLPFTLFLLTCGLLMTAWGLWTSRKAHQPGGKLPLIPAGLLMFLGLVLAFVMAAHVISLVTGVPFTGQNG